MTDYTNVVGKFFTTPPQEPAGTGIKELELDSLLDFHTGDGHPFEVELDEDMRELMDDVRENGVLEPIIARKDPDFDGRYEIITGHRRVFVLRELGKTHVKSIVVDYDDNAAIKLMVASNLKKRTHIKPSVKAKAYKMYMDANKKQAGRPKNVTEDNLCQVGTDLPTKNNLSPVETNLRTDEKAAEEFGESRANIQRYIRLNELIPELLAMVDADTIKFRTAVELSYLPKEAQEAVYSCMQAKMISTVSLEDATELKRYAKEGGEIDLAYLKQWLGIGQEEAETEPVKKPKKPKLNERFVNEYLPEDIRKKSVEEKRAYTKSALIFYNNYLLEHPEEQAEWEEEDES